MQTTQHTSMQVFPNANLRLTFAPHGELVEVHHSTGATTLRAADWNAIVHATSGRAAPTREVADWVSLFSQPGAHTAEAEPSTATSMPARLGEYVLARWRGDGGFGTVFEAVHASTRELHAVKVLKRRDPDSVTDLRQEARIAWSLIHEGLPAMFGLHRHGDIVFLAMELIDGRTIRDHVSAAPQHQRTETTVAAFERLTRIVAFLHAHSVVHNDLKPGNVLVRPGGQVSVIDLGLSTWSRPSDRVQPSGGATLAYAAPEWLDGVDSGAALDCYAMGVLLHECLTSRAPLAEHADPIAARAARMRPRRLDATDGVDAGLADLVDGLLEPDAARRTTALDAASLLSGVFDAGPTRETPLLGRDAELEVLWSARAAAGGGPRVVWVDGAPGIGKSALLGGFEASLRASDSPTFSARSYEHDHLSFRSLDAIVAGLAARLMARGLLDWDAPTTADVARLFPQLGEPTTPPTPVPPRLALDRASDALAEWVRLASETEPVTLLLDDAQWSDEDSAQLLSNLMTRRDLPLFCVCAVRTESQSALGAALRDHHGVAATRISLGPLDSAHARDLAHRVTPFPLPEHRLDELLAESRGEPYVVELIARHARHGSASPGDLDAIVSELRASLTEGDRVVADHVAVAASPIDDTIASEVATLHGLDGRRPLVTLRARRVLRSVDGAAPPRIAMYHDRLRNAWLRAIPSSTRTDCHRALLAAFEAHDGEPAERVPHHRALGDFARAADLSEAAAERSIRKLAFHDAAAHLRIALELRPVDHAGRADIRRRLASALHLAGRTAEAAEAWSAVVRDDGAAAGPADRRLAADAWMLSGHHQTGLALVKPRLAALRADPDRTAVRVGLSILGGLLQLIARGPRAAARTGAATERPEDEDIDLLWSLAKGLAFVDPAVGLDYALRSHRLAQRGGDAPRSARATAFVAASALMHIAPLRPLARRCLAYARETHAQAPEARLDAVLDVWEGMNAIAPGDWPHASARLTRALVVLEQHPDGLHWERGVAAGLIAWVLQLHGRFREERLLAERYLHDAYARGDRYGQLLFSQYVAYVELAADRPEETLRLAHEIGTAWPERGYSVLAFYAMLLEVMALLYTGEHAAAWARWENDQPKIRRAQYHRVPQGRIDNNLLEARLRLARPEGPNPTDVRRLEQLASAMRREARRDGAAHADWLHVASVLASRRSIESSRLDLLATRLDAGGLEAHAVAVRWWRERGATSRAPREAELLDLGVIAPGRWVRAFVPLPGLD